MRGPPTGAGVGWGWGRGSQEGSGRAVVKTATGTWHRGYPTRGTRGQIWDGASGGGGVTLGCSHHNINKIIAGARVTEPKTRACLTRVWKRQSARGCVGVAFRGPPAHPPFRAQLAVQVTSSSVPDSDALGRGRTGWRLEAQFNFQRPTAVPPCAELSAQERLGGAGGGGKAGWTYVVDMVGIADACGQKVIPAPGLDLRKPRGWGA